MDEYQEQRQNEIGIADVFRILLKRIKLLIAVLLAGAVIGSLCAWAAWRLSLYWERKHHNLNGPGAVSNS